MFEGYDIIIEGGQSNAEGSGTGEISAFDPFEPSEDILYLSIERKITCDNSDMHIEYPSDEFTIKIATETVYDGKLYADLALAFAKSYVNKGLLGSGRKLLIVRGAVGGSSFYCGHWGIDGSVYAKMIEMVDYAKRLHLKNKIVAFLWHQGESDILYHVDPKKYISNVKDILLDVRRRYEEMPFVCGNYVPEWMETHTEECDAFSEVYRKFALENKKVAFVESDGLLSNNQKLENGDSIHFCREALYELGNRYFSAFYDLI